MSEQPTTPVADDATATAAELHSRAATDYANGWGATGIRATAESDGDH
ncbi:hypothetical protein [Streptomyces canus]|nr:hypothetical protein [Streptomyces canus]